MLLPCKRNGEGVCLTTRLLHKTPQDCEQSYCISDLGRSSFRKGILYKRSKAATVSFSAAQAIVERSRNENPSSPSAAFSNSF
ncbi:unnamed protein product [Ixodes pacificus]